MQPSKSPSSSIPSSVPSITGAVSFVSISGAVTSNIAEDAIAAQLVEIYGADFSDVEISIDYVTSGTLNVSIPSDISEDDVLTALVESISDILGVHSRNVVVTIDEDDTVTYSITGETFTDAQEMQNVISNEDFVSNVTADLNEGNTGAVVELIAPNDSIEMTLSATIDTSDATGTLDTVEEIRDLTQKLGLTDSVVEGMYISNY